MYVAKSNLSFLVCAFLATVIQISRILHKEERNASEFECIFYDHICTLTL